jgi:hypothetical protein
MWARIENNAVAEIVDFDPSGKFHPDLVWTAIPAGVSVGDVMAADGTFSAPPVVPSVPSSVSRARARVALHNAGLLQQVEAIIADPATDPVTVIAWQDATEFQRTSPTLQALATQLGLTSADLDSLFIAAAQVQI